MKALIDTLVCFMLISDTTNSLVEEEGINIAQSVKGYVVVTDEYNPLTGENIIEYLNIHKQPIPKDYAIWMTYVKRRRR